MNFKVSARYALFQICIFIFTEEQRIESVPLMDRHVYGPCISICITSVRGWVYCIVSSEIKTQDLCWTRNEILLGCCHMYHISIQYI